ncbi:flavin dependent monooxygenase-like protein [Calycina marina]|uniref:Flavin dependent monooxygenase-like protein n=1 Tax=Calycina marina TaxID=1763456 RepID=A0A9P8CE59_9HELO|nr:flavin dependent monooxygenase-like protein [Calycina marina]
MGSVTTSHELFEVRRIAIIGAGPSGLAAAKYLIAEDSYEQLDVYEQQPEVGGVWFYSPEIVGVTPVPHTTPRGPPELPIWPKGSPAPLFSNPMYQHLNTNIPKPLMQYSDQNFDSQSRLFPSRQDVQTYLIKYSQDVRHLIKFFTQVADVHLVSKDGKDHWELTSRSIITEEQKTVEYDAVIVANGHYSVPFIPAVQGIEAFNAAYPSTIIHSKAYRSPDAFKNNKVIVIGSAASGLDIGTQISKVCRKPLLNSVKTSSELKLEQENKEEVPPIAEYLVDERAVRFEDGRIEKDIDAIVYCTGYLYSYPFLKSMEPPIVTNGRRVRDTYEQLFHINHPTLAFTALPQKSIPFPLSEAQAAAIAKVWANKLALPSKLKMIEFEEKRIEELGDGAGFHVLGFPNDARYINFMYDWVKTANDGFAKEPARWGSELVHLRERYQEVRKKFVEAGGQAKTLEELGFEFSLKY